MISCSRLTSSLSELSDMWIHFDISLILMASEGTFICLLLTPGPHVPAQIYLLMLSVAPSVWWLFWPQVSMLLLKRHTRDSQEPAADRFIPMGDKKKRNHLSVSKLTQKRTCFCFMTSGLGGLASWLLLSFSSCVLFFLFYCCRIKRGNILSLENITADLISGI